jgi:glycosyltransferase involved in cell wall biosynthesis
LKLSVCIPNRNDTVMLGVTIRSVLSALEGIESEIVIVDNSDHDIWQLIKTPNKSPIPLTYVQSEKIKLIRQDCPSLYAARQRAIDEASGEYIINIDSHTLIGRNTFRDSVEFMDSNKIGFGFFPVSHMSQPEIFAKHDIKPNTQGGVFGPWGRLYKEPTKICWGFGWRIGRKDWYEKINGYSFFALEQLAWGGGEFYVPIKSWLMGGECWAIPTDPVVHIGPYSDLCERLTGYKYRLYGNSGNHGVGTGIIAAMYALGGESAYDEAKRTELVVKKNHGMNVDAVWPKARKLAEHDYEWLEEKQEMSFTDFLQTKPWMGEWGEDRWSSWKPQKELKKTFNLNRL